jgi:PAS domain S-box-containing protein
MDSAIECTTPLVHESSFRALFEAALDAMLVVDDCGNYRDINVAACELFGLPKAKLLQQKIADFVVSELEFNQSWQHFLQTEQMRGEFHLRRVDGCLRTVEFSATANFSPGCHLLILRDVTDRKPLETQVLKSEVKLNSVLSHIHGTVACFHVFDDGRSEQDYLSPGHEVIFGFTAEEFKADKQLWQSRVLPEDWETVILPLYELIFAEQTSTVEYRFRHKDGRIRWISDTFTSYRDTAKNCWIVTVIGFDITDRKQAELKAQQTALSEQQMFQRERLISAITQNIRQSLDLDYILTTTVEEVQQFLQVDRVVIYRFNPDWTGKIIAEAVEEEEFSILNREIHDPCFYETMLPAYRQGRIHTINDVQTAELSPCYLTLLSRLRVRASLMIPILIRQNLWGLMIAHQCISPRQWQEGNWQILLQLSTQLAIGIHQAELYQQTQQQAQKEYALNQMIQVIRNSLDLTTIFSAVTSELGQLLQIDRAEILQFLPEQNRWLNIASYRQTPDLPDTLGLTVPATGMPFTKQLKRLEVVRVNGQPPSTTMLAPFPQTPASAWLLIPIQMGDGVWGSLSLSHSERFWQWQDWEVELAQAVTNQLSIAIQQSELYQAVQRLNNDLERQVEDRTAQLRQVLDFEELLKRITDNVRDSLDENQILQTVVRELALGLELSGCDVAIYEPSRHTFVIRYEYLCDRNLLSGQGQISATTATADLFTQLSQGISAQFCFIAPDPIRSAHRKYAILTCPIKSEHDFLGTLWLFRQRQDTFSPAEMRLIQQVANQCAIALRQSRLYQAAQAQVEELGKLNHMKDHFLSTVSHELRTPMSSIKMATEMLGIILRQSNANNTQVNDPKVLTPETYQRLDRYFNILQKECDREIELITNLLDLSRLDTEVEPLKPCKINLLIWLPEIIQPFVEQARNQGQHLRLQLPKRLPDLTTDPTYLERILSELLTNACKYTPTGETITLSAQLINPQRHPSASPYSALTLRILNTGIEIPAQELPRIFDKFHRVVSSDPWKHSGTGLGLALVKKLSDLLGCTIQVESQAGQTEFTLQFEMEEKGRGRGVKE